MDIIFASAIKGTQLLIVCISYDIVCQWFINIFLRMVHWPSDFRPRPGLHLRPFIPKFHYWAHKEEDHEQYSLNYGDGAALTDGEAIERVWGGHNALAGSTKVSGPGTRQDILDDNFGYWNYLKYISIGLSDETTKGSMLTYESSQVNLSSNDTKKPYPKGIGKWRHIEDLQRHCQHLSYPNGTICALNGVPIFSQSPRQIHMRRMMLVRTYPTINYQREVEVIALEITENEAEQELEALEASKRSTGVPPVHKTTATKCLRLGLDLEESQYVIIFI